MMAVEISNLQRAVPIVAPRIRRAAAGALRALGRAGFLVHLTFVNDARIRRLNAAHRGVDRATDVLAFSLQGPGPSRLWGEVVVSAETARRQARRLGVPVGRELELLVVHGLLHLAGWDDRHGPEARLMHQREREILGRRTRRLSARLWSGLLPG
jgi:probable rRNA maturation factor